MSRFVRQSKYRHVFGTLAKNELQFTNVKISRSAWDSDKISINSKFLAVCWEATGGGSAAVLKRDAPQKFGANIPLITGHKAAVLSVSFSPFHDNILSTASEDATVKIWNIPDEGVTENMNEPIQNLVGHRRKVGTVNWHPTCSNVLATSSTDFKVIIWDAEKGEKKMENTQHGDIIQSVAWSWNGDLIATTCKDKKVRVFDPRTEEVVHEVSPHTGIKGSRVLWLGSKNKFFTVGFGRTSERQYALFDPRDTSKPQAKANIDTASGQIMPFYDNDTSMVFLAGKGDGNIRYYEITDDDKFIYPLSEFKSSTPQRGMGFAPKYTCDVNACEVAKCYKLTGTEVQPISFCVPRKSDLFQDDIFPDTAGPEPSGNQDDYFGGANPDPKLVSMEAAFDGTKIQAKPQEFKAEKKEIDEGPKTEKELREAWQKQKDRIAYLEGELVKRDAKIKELEGGN